MKPLRFFLGPWDDPYLFVSQVPRVKLNEWCRSCTQSVSVSFQSYYAYTSLILYGYVAEMWSVPTFLLRGLLQMGCPPKRTPLVLDSSSLFRHVINVVVLLPTTRLNQRIHRSGYYSSHKRMVESTFVNTTYRLQKEDRVLSFRVTTLRNPRNANKQHQITK